MKLSFHQAYEKEPFAAFSRSVMKTESVCLVQVFCDWNLVFIQQHRLAWAPVHSTALRVRTRVHRHGRFHHRTLSSFQSPEESL